MESQKFNWFPPAISERFEYISFFFLIHIYVPPRTLILLWIICTSHTANSISLSLALKKNTQIKTEGGAVPYGKPSEHQCSALSFAHSLDVPCHFWGAPGSVDPSQCCPLIPPPPQGYSCHGAALCLRQVDEVALHAAKADVPAELMGRLREGRAQSPTLTSALSSAMGTGGTCRNSSRIPRELSPLLAEGSQ